MQGKVVKIFITKDDENKTRLTPQEIQVDPEGIIGDKFYAKDNQRAILITATDSYKLTQENNINLETGSLGENLLIDINPYHLTPGSRFIVGDTTLEITQNCTLCKGLSTLNAQLPKLLKNDRGIFAKVVSGSSIIKIGDTVEI
ncbi:MOSC domain-containing protein [Sulfurimonas paralvinellae]|uniref:MOSC domain-containing protein n=1 Tax=Sulfurimonas paralvinellae TaxID=317658 RepID=A0A7M1BA65_9BACT|nr:MOSC domain-containing protein [Sulfurimonas paralvinellae]QOP46610.1 MOSC domain-containing protein [Sulfurimonas paralvinellae]